MEDCEFGDYATSHPSISPLGNSAVPMSQVKTFREYRHSTGSMRRFPTLATVSKQSRPQVLTLEAIKLPVAAHE